MVTRARTTGLNSRFQACFCVRALLPLCAGGPVWDRVGAHFSGTAELMPSSVAAPRRQATVPRDQLNGSRSDEQPFD